MPEPKVYEFSKHIGALCVTRDTNVHKLGARLGIDPMELMRMINGRAMPTKAVVAGLAKELGSDVRYLEKLAEEIRADLGAK
jgi:transcriptional regulator with XRE-family HTH domain